VEVFHLPLTKLTTPKVGDEFGGLLLGGLSVEVRRGKFA
jgi:hypothetical protein